MSAWFHNLRLRWKILLAPAILVVVLVGIGGEALLTQRANQATVDTLMAGPVHDADNLSDFTTAIWTAQARLYRLTATAANETDANKVKAMAAETAKSVGNIAQNLKAIDSVNVSDAKTKEALD